jgi:hypothetical protein
MTKLHLTESESELIFYALEELYENLQYNELSELELRKQQLAISAIIGKLEVMA